MMTIEINDRYHQPIVLVPNSLVTLIENVIVVGLIVVAAALAADFRL